jgi:hypothetical protein
LARRVLEVRIYRRENGEWKVVHRHGDALAEPTPPES